MTLCSAQVVLRTADNLPENFVTNTIHYDTTGELLDVAGEVTTALATFYNALRVYMSDALSETGHMVKHYLVDQPKPNYPFLEDPWSFTDSLVGNPLPAEVAICCSYQAARVNGENQSSRRGRIYLGPLNDDCNLDGRIQPGIQQAIRTAFAALAQNIYGAGALTQMVVYSPTNNSHADVVDGWVDNAFDTQRRRGVLSSSRAVWDLGS